jgi:hypothetical protein
LLLAEGNLPPGQAFTLHLLLATGTSPGPSYPLWTPSIEPALISHEKCMCLSLYVSTYIHDVQGKLFKGTVRKKE